MANPRDLNDQIPPPPELEDDDIVPPPPPEDEFSSNESEELVSIPEEKDEEVREVDNFLSKEKEFKQSKEILEFHAAIFGRQGKLDDAFYQSNSDNITALNNSIKAVSKISGSTESKALDLLTGIESSIKQHIRKNPKKAGDFKEPLKLLATAITDKKYKLGVGDKKSTEQTFPILEKLKKTYEDNTKGVTYYRKDLEDFLAQVASVFQNKFSSISKIQRDFIAKETVNEMINQEIDGGAVHNISAEEKQRYIKDVTEPVLQKLEKSKSLAKEPQKKPGFFDRLRGKTAGSVSTTPRLGGKKT